MLEILLILSLLGNGWLLQDSGELAQSNKQLQEVVSGQRALIGGAYNEIGKLEKELIKVERVREEIFAQSEERSIELEELRNSNTTVDDYLNQTVPASVVEHLQAYSED